MHAGRHIPQLDGYRGFAALLVVVSHFANRTLVGMDLDNVLSGGPETWSLADLQALVLGAFGNGAGQLGVMIFFSLSSFLMFHLYFDQPATGYTISRYIVGRAARILPLYYFAVALAFLSTLYLPWTYIEVGSDDLLGHIFFYKGTSVFWTLAPEIVFYLVFALIWRVSGGKHLVLAPAALVIVLTSNLFPVVWRSYTVEFFMVGYCVWLYTRSPYRLRLTGWIAGAAVGVFCLSLFLHLPAVHKVLFGAPAWMGWQEIRYAALVFGLFVLVLDSSWLRAFFSWRPIRFVGEISFSLYLLHLFVLKGLYYIDVVGPDILSLAGATIVCIMLSTGLYYAYERPARKFIRQMFAKGWPEYNGRASRTEPL